MTIRKIKKGVYIIREGNRNRYKIGYSTDIDERLKQLQTGNSDTLILFHYFPTDDLRKIESLAKNYADINNIRGEWFELTENAVINLCCFINKCISIELTPNVNKNKKSKLNNTTISTKNQDNLKIDEIVPIKNISSDEKPIQIYKCPFCENTYSSSSTLTIHKKVCVEIMQDPEIINLKKINEKLQKQVEIYEHMLISITSS